MKANTEMFLEYFVHCVIRKVALFNIIIKLVVYFLTLKVIFQVRGIYHRIYGVC
jgi:hypothetical protein